ncbi:glycine--tRNA ligase subunit beta [Sphingomonas kyeonggiensis]|uniref:Glycine--tRNA ligase beta subunit n=1 Tax=Sphingomonas kyeonggiensis TaxID=1268553 RepID=A0A7W6JRZ0_9SPHN|nr:glycine--tRNA ligase subunit beta [Sphingomonas kyeonggiensis]MBB4098471.1 glycyl-tRNA synthetase beta chain [Sphingomonas kyeonggiensis]
MSVQDFLLELRSEEIPARMQEKARADLAALFEARLQALNLPFESIESYATPRRLALIVRGVAEMTAAASEERKGPRADAPAQAIEGFLRSTGLSREQLVERDDGKGNKVLFAVIDRPGIVAGSVLASAITGAITAFPWPKSMRWGAASSSTESQRWVRPLQGIIALLGDKLVPVEIAGVKSASVTVGHRFHHPGGITIGSANDYIEKLRACHVIVDGAERRNIIALGAKMAAQKAGLTLIEDDGLLYENAGLTEWPMPLLGRFDEAFLDVPPEVIQLTARVNQKYFVCRDSAGKLANAFVCVANIDAADGGEKIVEGNQKVLAARLSDARFFYETDLKTRLEDLTPKLEKIVFHEKLGTVADKVDRVAKLARWLAEEGIVKADPDQAERAARLAKADLVTGMVGEFPELQGLMGGYYAAAQGEPAAVAEAIRDHYKPVGQGDDVPTAPVTVAVALADKLDSITSFFGVDLKPSGSKDPFALRRSALGVIALILDNGLRFPLTKSASKDVLDFFADRLKVQQKEAGVRHDLIDAVFALGGEDDLVRLLARVKALQSFVTSEDGRNLLAGYKRAANILKKETWAPGEVADNEIYEAEPAEAALREALDVAEPKAEAAVEAEDYEAAMAALASLRAPIDKFFDDVTVVDPDAFKREMRLGLLARIRDAVNNVADFSKIEG